MFDEMCTDCGWKSADACKTCAQERTLTKRETLVNLATDLGAVLDDIRTFADPVERAAAQDALAREAAHGVGFDNDDGILTPYVF